MHVTALGEYSGRFSGQNHKAESPPSPADVPVATAKVRIPATAAGTLARERLDDMLDAAVDSAAVTVVRAPAGTGKTTTLATWARRQAQLGAAYVAWASVDSEDNESWLLWRVVLRALRNSGAWPGDCPLDRLTPPKNEPYSAFLNAVIAAFERLAKPVILVIDGVHDIHHDNAVHTLNILLRRLPAALRIVFATRFPPPLILHRLKLEGRLSEIGPADLTFSSEEVRQFFEHQDIELADTGLAAVQARTEGWAAALRLSAITLAQSPQPVESVSLSGDDRVVADYLTGEILVRQPPEVQHFLLASCVCDTFGVELATALSGQENTGQLLDQLERNGIVLQDNSTAWYRYHPLLREFLRAELRRRGQSAVRRYHRVATSWFLLHGQPLPAIEHGIAAGDDDLVTRLVAKSGLELVLKGHSAALSRIIEGAPAHVLARPSVALVAAAAALDLGDVPAADRWLHATNHASNALRTHRLRALHATVRLHRARLRGDVNTALAALRQTRAGNTGDSDLDLLAVFNRGVAAAWTGRRQQAKTDLHQALQLALAGHRDAIAVQCKVHLAAMAAVEGDLAAMGTQAAAALNFAASRGWTSDAYLYTVLGLEAYQRMEDERAQQLAMLATKLMPDTADPTIELAALTLHCVIAFDNTEEPHKVTAALREHWRRLATTTVSPALIAYAAPTQQRMALRVGEYNWALEILARVEELVPCGERALLRAVLLAHKGKLTTARRMLTPVLTGQLRTLVAPTLLEAWLLEAHLADRCADSHRAHEALSQALAIAAPHHALRPFREAGHSVRDLLARGAGRFGRQEPFATEIRATLPASVPTLTDGLTEREHQLLAELPSMRTAEEIAQDLFVSVNTVKTHLRGIYRKLGVSQRRDAISVARERGLL